MTGGSSLNIYFAFDGRRAVDAAGDYVRLRSLRFAPTHIHRPYSRRCRVGCKVVAKPTRVGCKVVVAKPTRAAVALVAKSSSRSLLASLSRRLQSRRREAYLLSLIYSLFTTNKLI
jgi:hypothetical protein